MTPEFLTALWLTMFPPKPACIETAHEKICTWESLRAAYPQTWDLNGDKKIFTVKEWEHYNPRPVTGLVSYLKGNALCLGGKDQSRARYARAINPKYADQFRLKEQFTKSNMQVCWAVDVNKELYLTNKKGRLFRDTDDSFQLILREIMIYLPTPLPLKTPEKYLLEELCFPAKKHGGHVKVKVRP